VRENVFDGKPEIRQEDVWFHSVFCADTELETFSGSKGLKRNKCTSDLGATIGIGIWHLHDVAIQNASCECSPFIVVCKSA